MLDQTTETAAADRNARACLNALETYWNALFRAKRLPKRADVNPLDIDHALPHAILIEQVAPGVARLRVSGQRVNACLGMDAQGMPLSAFFLPAARAGLTLALEQTFTTPALVELPIQSPRGLGRPLLRGRLLLLPLADDYGMVTRALGAFYVDGHVGRGPRRFEIADGAQRHEPVDRRRPITVVPASSGSRHAGPAITGADKRPVTTGRPALKLVINNDA